MTQTHKGNNLIVCDLDNTLYDWVAYFVPSFYAMVDKLVEQTKWNREHVLNDFKKVHQKHHNSEHPFSIFELEIVSEKMAGFDFEQIKAELDQPLHAFNKARKEHLKLYTGVIETLNHLKKNDYSIAAHTDSDLHAVSSRLDRLGLIDVFDHIYCKKPGITQHPEGKKVPHWKQGFPIDRVTELNNNQGKPNPEILFKICSDFNSIPDKTLYVGDSMSRDMLMAEKSGVISIWAKYGTKHQKSYYEKLARISHWTTEDIKNEKKLQGEIANITPDHILENGFWELLPLLNLD